MRTWQIQFALVEARFSSITLFGSTLRTFPLSHRTAVIFFSTFFSSFFLLSSRMTWNHNKAVEETLLLMLDTEKCARDIEFFCFSFSFRVCRETLQYSHVQLLERTESQYTIPQIAITNRLISTHTLIAHPLICMQGLSPPLFAFLSLKLDSICVKRFIRKIYTSSCSSAYWILLKINGTCNCHSLYPVWLLSFWRL